MRHVDNELYAFLSEPLRPPRPLRWEFDLNGETSMIPGEVFTASGEIELNRGRPTITLKVANSGDRPIQVGSHYHFFETNAALKFDRAAARGYRLNIPAGTAVRFEPGQQRTVELVALSGDRVVYGFLGAIMGKLDKSIDKYKPGRRSSFAQRSPRPPGEGMGMEVRESSDEENHVKLDKAKRAGPRAKGRK